VKGTNENVASLSSENFHIHIYFRYKLQFQEVMSPNPSRHYRNGSIFKGEDFCSPSKILRTLVICL
jgi:hypothetical protein